MDGHLIYQQKKRTDKYDHVYGVLYALCRLPEAERQKTPTPQTAESAPLSSPGAGKAWRRLTVLLMYSSSKQQLSMLIDHIVFH